MPGPRDRSASFEALIDRTIAVWEPRLGRSVSREEAREIIANVTGFVGLLIEIDRECKRAFAPESERVRMEG